MEDPSQAPNRVLSLVQYCQRVAILHANSLSGVGYNVSFDLVKPVLDHCSASTLMRVEDATPNLKQDTNGLWKKLCSKDLPLDALKYLEGTLPVPQSWRQLYEDLYAARAKKLEEVQSKLRSSRMGEIMKRKESNIKLADAPPIKRARTWGVPVQPKTLFQKTRTEATKTQRLFTSQSRPPMLAAKTYRNASDLPASEKLLMSPYSVALSGSTGKTNPRVTVRPVAAPTTTSTWPSPSTSSAPSPLSDVSTQSLHPSASKPNPRVTVRPLVLETPTPAASVAPPLASSVGSILHAPTKNVLDPTSTARTTPSAVVASPRPMKPLPGSKKPSKSLFMPRHRSYNQLLGHSQVSPPR